MADSIPTSPIKQFHRFTSILLLQTPSSLRSSDFLSALLSSALAQSGEVLRLRPEFAFCFFFFFFFNSRNALCVSLSFNVELYLEMVFFFFICPGFRVWIDGYFGWIVLIHNRISQRCVVGGFDPCTLGNSTRNFSIPFERMIGAVHLVFAWFRMILRNLREILIVRDIGNLISLTILHLSFLWKSC